MSVNSDAAVLALEVAADLQGETVTFERDGVEVEIVNAVRGSTNWDAESPFPQSRVNDHSTDWIIETAALVDDEGDELEPQRGDSFTVKATGEVFKVMPHGKHSVLWRWVDQTGQAFRRVFTRERG